MPPVSPSRTAVVIPAWHHQEALDRLLGELPEGLEILVVDDGSEPPIRTGRGRLLRHPANRGYGAAQKTGFRSALEAGADRVLLLHGDGQYPVADVLGLGDALDQDDADVAVGSRFLARCGDRVPGWRRAGIRGLTTLANLRFGTRFTDLHNGARAFRASFLTSLPLERMSDDFLFDHELLTLALRRGLRVVERPVGITYAGVSSIRPWPAVRYGLGCLGTLAR